MLEMLRHLGREDHVDQALSHDFEGFMVQILENVDSRVRQGEFEGERSVMRFQDRQVIVQKGKVVGGVDEERAARRQLF